MPRRHTRPSRRTAVTAASTRRLLAAFRGPVALAAVGAVVLGPAATAVQMREAGSDHAWATHSGSDSHPVPHGVVRAAPLGDHRDDPTGSPSTPAPVAEAAPSPAPTEAHTHASTVVSARSASAPGQPTRVAPKVTTSTLTVRPPAAPAPPVAGGFPDAGSTGVPAGTQLTPSGDITISTPGQVVDALDIRGTVLITASNVTLKRSRVVSSGGFLVKVANGATGVRIENVEINGLGLSGSANSMGVFGSATVLRSNISGVENGIAPDSGSLVQDNFIHGLAAPGSPHYDGVQIDGGVSNVRIVNNTVDMRGLSQTSTVMVDNYFGPISNVAVDRNRLLGGGYVVYCDGRFTGGPISGVSFTNNRMGDGYWGNALIDACQPAWSNNVSDATGAPISP